MEKKQLELGKMYMTFVNDDNIIARIEELTKLHTVTNKKVYHFKSESSISEDFITYALDKEFRNTMRDTVVIHRNKAHQVLYSMNAVNKITNGIPGTAIDFSKYSNMLLTVKWGQLHQIPVKLIKTINVK